jgi:hypothetical protein
MRYVLLFILCTSLTGCFKDCNSSNTPCNANQIAAVGSAIGSKCYCACDVDHEGADCSIFKSTKFIGTYSGALILNDTQIVSTIFTVAPSLEDSSLLVVNRNYMVLLADTASLCVFIRGIDIFLPPVFNGGGYLSTDQKRLTLNYQVSGTGTVGTFNYTFIGIRQ